jgi:hypothetical protein
VLLSVAMSALATLPDGADPASLWAALVPEVPETRLWAELDRLGVSERLMLARDGERCVDFQSAGQGAVYLSDLVGGTVEHVWSGSIDDAIARVARLPRNAGVDAFWSAFPDAD